MASASRHKRNQQVLHVHAGLRVEGAERLVHQDDPRPQDQRPGDRHPLPHAAGKLVRILVGVGRHVQPDVLDPLAAELLALAAADALALQAEGDVLQHRAVIEAGVILEDHAAVGAGSGNRLSLAPALRRVVGGCCGVRPAINRRIVLLPQPLGPRTQTNSPLFGRSSTKKLTSRMAVYSFGWPAL